MIKSKPDKEKQVHQIGRGKKLHIWRNGEKIIHFQL